MPGDWKQALEARLADVPKGELLVCAKSDTLFFSPPACACIGQDDKGRLDIWPLYPGVELTLQAYSAKFVAFHHDVPGATLLENGFDIALEKRGAAIWFYEKAGR